MIDTHDGQHQRWLNCLSVLQPAFTRPGWKLLQSLMIGWVLCTGRRTVVGIYQQAEPTQKRAHDSYHRFIRCGSGSPEEVWRLLAQAMVSSLAPEGPIEVDLDDTLLHRSGRKVNGAGAWRDAVRSSGKHTVIARGLNQVLVTLRVHSPWGGEPLGLPIWVTLHRKGGAKLTELAREALRVLAEWFPGRKIQCCADGAYASTLMPLHSPTLTCISRIRRDAALYDIKPERTGRQGRPAEKGRRLGTPEQIADKATEWKLMKVNLRGKIATKWVYSATVLWYSVSKRPVQFVICRDPDDCEPDDFFVCSDTDMDPAEVISAYAGRWSIEDTFRATKQTIHVQEPQSWAGQGPERAAMLGFLLHSLIWWWFLGLPADQQQVQATPWFPSKSTPSFADAFAALRMVFWQNRISSTSAGESHMNEIMEAMLKALVRAA